MSGITVSDHDSSCVSINATREPRFTYEQHSSGGRVRAFDVVIVEVRVPHKRANTSRLSGQWSDDDYDVLEIGVTGRIFLSPAAPQDRPWMWASGHNGNIRRAAHGYEPTREAAMQAFAKSWHRET
jgi:hypothetical protein